MLKLMTPPVTEVATLADLKAYASVIGSSDDVLLQKLLDGATQAHDGAYGSLGRALAPQTWRWEIPGGFPAGSLRIPLPPCINVDQVAYRDADDEDQNFLDYNVDGIDAYDGAVLTPVTRWPSTTLATVTFQAGFVDTIPEDIVTLVLATAAANYAWRESSILATGTLSGNPVVQSIQDSWRVRGFG